MTFLSRIGLALSSVFLVVSTSVNAQSMSELRDYYGEHRELLPAAVESQNPDHIKSILSFGASKQEIMTAIFAAVRKDKVISLKALVDYGRKNIEDFNNELNNWKIDNSDSLMGGYFGKKLFNLEQKANYDRTVYRKANVLQLAVSKKNLEMVNILLPGMDADIFYGYMYTSGPDAQLGRIWGRGYYGLVSNDKFVWKRNYEPDITDLLEKHGANLSSYTFDATEAEKGRVKAVPLP